MAFRRVLGSTLLVVTAGANASRATPASGVSATTPERASFAGPLKATSTAADLAWGVALAAEPDLDVATQTIVFAPDGHTGWHRNPGPALVSVVEGTETFYDAGDRDCQVIVRTAGEGYLDTGTHAYIARNETGAQARVVVTYFVPARASQRIDEPAPSPSDCSF